MKKVWRMMLMILAAGLFLCGYDYQFEEETDCYVYDGADILDDREEEELNTYISEIREAAKCDFLLVTTLTPESSQTEDCAYEVLDQWFYDHYTYEYEGHTIVLFVNMKDREMYICENYSSQTCLSESEIDEAVDIAVSFFKDDRFMEGTGAVFEYASDILINTVSSDTYRCRILEDGTLRIDEYDCYDEELTIPEEIEGRTVSAIGDNAFSWCYSLERVSIPDSIVSVGSNPFAECISLKEINVSMRHPALALIDGILYSKEDKRLICCPAGSENTACEIPNGIRIIGERAFYNCSNIISITVPDTVSSIGANAFTCCGCLSEINIPDGVETIEAFTFCECVSLLHIQIPDSVTAIEEYAFSWCMRLTDVVLPEHLTSIGDCAFLYCSLSGITIPDSVQYVGANPFAEASLTDIYVSPDHPFLAVEDGVLFGREDKRLISYPYLRDDPVYEIPDGTEIIGDMAFTCIDDLQKIIIPDSVVSIGESAFAYCNYLEEMTIPDSVVSIGEKAFYYCSELTDIVIPGSVEAIESQTFSGCQALKNVTISEGVGSVGDYAFSECSSLISIEIPGSIESIGTEAFSYCENLTKVILHDGVKTIGDYVFLQCYSLESAVFPDSISEMGEYVFCCCESLSDTVFPEQITAVPRGTFSWCSGLTNVVIPEGVTVIEGEAFYECIGLSEVMIPEGVVSIGGSAFDGCENLIDVSLPESLTDIGFNAFYGDWYAVFTVVQDSYAEQYCEDNAFQYVYTDYLDWLND